MSARASASMRGAGAAAVSILTEPSRFDGSLDDLAAGAALARAAQRAGNAQGFPRRRLPGARGPRSPARAACSPSFACCRARTSSSSSTPRSSCRCSCCSRLSTRADIELAHALVEARRAQRDLLLVGVNSRDLATLEVVPGTARCARVACCRGDVKRVAESGVATRGRCRARGRLRLRPRAGGQRAHVGRRSGTRWRAPCSPKAARPSARAPRWSQAAHELRQPFIKICGMTTPGRGQHAALACEVDAIGFVFAPSVRQVSLQRANELAAPARHKVACVAVTRHPTREAIEAHPARLQARHPADRHR